MKVICLSKIWEKKCKSNKVCEWIDNNVIWYLWDKPKSAYKSVRHWFHCNFNKYHWRLVKQAFVSYPWDGQFLLDLEERQIDKQIHWFVHHQLMVDEQYNEIKRSLRWAKHCIHAMNNETDYFHYDGEIKSIPQIRDENGKFVDGEIGMDAEYYRLDSDNVVYNYDGPYLNKRNARRFLDKRLIESEYFKKGNMDHEYYIKKAQHLYYKIRERYTQLWWD